MAEAWPSELRLHENGTRLTIQFDDASHYDLPPNISGSRARAPRCRAIAPQSARRSAAKNVRIVEISPVGNYAVRLDFDDGHNTGIFSWGYLAELGRDLRSQMGGVPAGAGGQRA